MELTLQQTKQQVQKKVSVCKKASSTTWKWQTDFHGTKAKTKASRSILLLPRNKKDAQYTTYGAVIQHLGSIGHEELDAWVLSQRIMAVSL